MRDEARALARLLDQSNVMARLSLALEALEDCYGSPAFRFARDYQSSFWHQLVLSSVNKTFYHAFHPHVWNFCTIRTRDDLAAFQLHSRKAISYISIVDVSLSHIHPFLRDHRRTLSSIDIFFPPVYTSQSRQKVMSTLAELPLLKHLRLRDVGRPLSIEAICPILLEAPQLISLDIEQVILPGPNWGLAGVASLRCNLETIILRASIAPSSGTGGAALQRLLTPVASTLMHFAIHQPTHDILVEEGDEEEAQ